MIVPLTGCDQESHLPAVHALLSVQERRALSGGIRQAAFWVGFRQEMVVAFINQRGIVPVLEHCNIDRTFSPADERTWTNRMIVHCADVITYCFQDGMSDVSRYRALDQYANDWMSHKPMSFKLLYQYSPLEGQFLQLCYEGDTVVAGVQHYHLSQILLAAHDPTIPRIGPQRKKRERMVNVGSTSPAYFYAITLYLGQSKRTCSRFMRHSSGQWCKRSPLGMCLSWHLTL